METIELTFITNMGITAYLLIFLFLAIGAVGIIGEEITLMFAGYLASVGQLSLPIVIIISIIGIICADTIGYHLGKEGKGIIRKLHIWTKIKALKPKNLFKHAKKLRKKPELLFFGRFMPTIRCIFPIVAGLSGYKWKKFAKINIIAAIIFAPTMIMIGFYLKAIPPIIIGLTGITMFILYFIFKKVFNPAKA